MESPEKLATKQWSTSAASLARTHNEARIGPSTPVEKQAMQLQPDLVALWAMGIASMLVLIPSLYLMAKSWLQRPYTHA